MVIKTGLIFYRVFKKNIFMTTVKHVTELYLKSYFKCNNLSNHILVNTFVVIRQIKFLFF